MTRSHLPPSYYIGLLSGTSMDAIDAAIIDFSSHLPSMISAHSHPIPNELAHKTRVLYRSGKNEIEQLGQLDIEWGKLFGQAVITLLEKSNCTRDNIIAIGSHGQTIRHHPHGKTPFTLQIGDPNTIAMLSGINTVADFRRMDIACGGQGAPLAPAFHRHLFQHKNHDTLVINIGGISNITYLPSNPRLPLIGYDIGPGNTLMDAWCRRHLNRPYDENGTWAMQGAVNLELLSQLLKDPYFSQVPPKSTGPEYFHLDWLGSDDSAPQNTQRTLLELTAQTICQDVVRLTKTNHTRVLICGGGARNHPLLHRLKTILGACFSVETTDQHGIASDWLEAMLFAWLAKMRTEGNALDLSHITGSTQKKVLGGVFLGSI
ncbi:MAG: anhydro-N-acetylmuramic acid kinase [Gammaproteobacteria bacterium]|nr:anhydro-N-acetylmuramic acid kinase [Gammaproteobacteria bacterium]MCD8542982.1 anhydro-N-acetylmuramic acid kinase [Gammaproteobacteria bacterium]